MNILLVEPNFPIPAKSKNHCNFLPIGLLKIAAYHREQGDIVELHRGNYIAERYPDEIKITSLFTYWSKHVWDSVGFYKYLYPDAKVEVGGIYASLMPEHCAKSGCDEVGVGFYKGGVAEEYDPAYDMVNVDYQIVHGSRGCFRRCNFCGTWKIEDKVTYKSTILKEITKQKIVFYDNNLIANPHIKTILYELENFTFKNKKKVICESQSGLDGRILQKAPELATLLKKARFKNPRIAWDGSYSQWPLIKEQIEILKSANYKPLDIYIFMIFNFKSSYKELKQKLDACRRWGVRVIDCRYRPLNLTSDGYNPRKKHQESNEYFIHPGWTDSNVRSFRRAVRRQNIALILDLPNGKYIEGIEKRYIQT